MGRVSLQCFQGSLFHGLWMQGKKGGLGKAGTEGKVYIL